MPAIRYETPGGVRELQVSSSEIEYNEETQHWRVKRGEKNGRDVYEHVPRERVFSVQMIGKETGTVVTRT